MTNICEIAGIISDIWSTIDFFRRSRLLKDDYMCCNHMCSKVMDISLSDQEIFQCNYCSKCYSIDAESFFFNFKLPLTVHVVMLYFFSNGSQLSECCKYLEGKVSKKTCLQWYSYY